MNRFELINIVDKRLEEWGEFLISENAVPILLIGKKEGEKPCNLVAASDEEVPQEQLVAFLEDMIKAIKSGKGPAEWK